MKKIFTFFSALLVVLNVVAANPAATSELGKSSAKELNNAQISNHVALKEAFQKSNVTNAHHLAQAPAVSNYTNLTATTYSAEYYTSSGDWFCVLLVDGIPYRFDIVTNDPKPLNGTYSLAQMDASYSWTGIPGQSSQHRYTAASFTVSYSDSMYVDAYVTLDNDEKYHIHYAKGGTINLTFDNTDKPSFKYYASDGDWYFGWNTSDGKYTIRFDRVTDYANKFAHFTLADLDATYSFLTDYTSGEKVNLYYISVDVTLAPCGKNGVTISGTVTCHDGYTYVLSGTYYNPVKVEHLYLVGDATPVDWESSLDDWLEFTAEGNDVFTITTTLNNTGAEGFKIPSARDWTSPTLHASVNGMMLDEVESDSVIVFCEGEGDDNKWKVSETGRYTITVRLIDNNTDEVIGIVSVKPAINYWLVGTAAESGWDQTNAMPMEGDSIVRHLAAGTYEFKVLTQEASWTGALGASAVDSTASSPNWYGNDNVAFELENEGDVTIAVAEGKIVLTGTFKKQESYDYYIKYAGNNWTWVGMTMFDGGASYTHEGVWGGTGANVNTTAGDAGALWFPEADIHFVNLEGEEAPVAEVGTEGEYFYYPVESELYFSYNYTPSAIENTKADMKAIKAIENGQLVIIRDGKRFNAVGAQF